MTDQEWKASVERRLHAIETSNAVDEVHRVNVDKRLSSIEDTLKWLVRLVIGALILAAVGFALNGGFQI